jgi:hypothetical protein
MKLPKGPGFSLQQLRLRAGFAAWDGPLKSQTFGKGGISTEANQYFSYGVADAPARVNHF